MLMRNLPIAYLLIGLLLILGIVGTWGEYRNWKKTETQRYGHGWAQTQTIKEPEKLVGPYVNEKLGYRLRYPIGWQMTEDGKKITFTNPANPAINFSFEIQTNPQSLIDIADREALPGLAREREYLNIESYNWTILTFEKDNRLIQKALSKRNDQLFVVEASLPKENWNEFTNTFWEIYKSVVIF